MKIAILQIDVLDSKLEANAAKILDKCKEAYSYGAEFCIVPENSLVGPLYQTGENIFDFAELYKNTLNNLASQLPCAGNFKLLLYNPAASANILIIKSNSIEICANTLQENCLTLEKPWFDKNIIKIHFQNWTVCQNPQVKIRSKSETPNGIIHIYPNLVGGYNGQVYPGKTQVTEISGKIINQGKSFTEDIIYLDLTNPETDSVLLSQSIPEDLFLEQWQALVLGTQDFVRKAGAKSAILGLSGGIDSALVACVATAALGENNITGILMPSPYSSEHSISDSLELAKNLGIKTFIVPIAPIMRAFELSFKESFADLNLSPEKLAKDLTFENLQARIRGAILMAFSNRTGALVLNTGNKSESSMGYCTLYGDMVGALSVIGDIYKTRIYELAHWYNKKIHINGIPQNILEKEPSAELRPNQKDTDSLLPYPVLDKILSSLESGIIPDNPKEYSIWQETAAKKRSFAYKRNQLPPVLEVGCICSKICQ